ncbi:MAG: hypothetical protein GX259_06470 [Bacteroidales bacterium]|jgi:xanthine/uracil permease|nr:hypothetical protein [Bacteroidales bacterium]
MKKLLRNIINFPSLIGIIIGAFGGYFYYAFVGCKSGSCPITSSPWASLAWGLILGWLVGNMFYKDKD